MTDAVAEDLGVAIKKCAEFMATVHTETATLLKEVDGLLEASGFESVKGSGIFVSESSTKNIDVPSGWGHRMVARMLGDGKKKKSSTRVVVAEAHFAPPSGFDRAVFILGCARFEEPQNRDALTTGYVGSMADVFSEDPEFDAVRKLVRSADSELFPNADEVRAMAWPLVSLDSPEKVRDLVTKAMRAFGL